MWCVDGGAGGSGKRGLMVVVGDLGDGDGGGETGVRGGGGREDSWWWWVILLGDGGDEMVFLGVGEKGFGVDSGGGASGRGFDVDCGVEGIEEEGHTSGDEGEVSSGCCGCVGSC